MRDHREDKNLHGPSDGPLYQTVDEEAGDKGHKHVSHAQGHVAQHRHEDAMVSVTIHDHHDYWSYEVGRIYKLTHCVEGRVAKEQPTDVGMPENYIERKKHPSEGITRASETEERNVGYFGPRIGILRAEE